MCVIRVARLGPSQHSINEYGHGQCRINFFDSAEPGQQHKMHFLYKIANNTQILLLYSALFVSLDLLSLSNLFFVDAASDIVDCIDAGKCELAEEFDRVLIFLVE